MGPSAAENSGHEPPDRTAETGGEVHTARGHPQPSPPAGDRSQGNGLTELRGLIVGPEQQQLRQLKDRLDDPNSLARDVGRVLPEAFVLRSADPRISEALAPAVEKAMTASVRANPHALADALFPVIGPAIRKAIASALGSMIEGLNRSLEKTFSLRGLGWRLEALRTGRPFAEVVLLHTVVYRVEQVFLIHRETGLLLAHVAASDAVVQDADMVSGMLSAIRDFVHDSFGTGKAPDSLDAVRVGELTLVIEQGPQAIVAGLVRGAVPLELRTILQQALETVHLRLASQLSSFQGDAGPFAAASPYLESCLKAQYLDKKGATPSRVWVAAGIVGLLLALWIGWTIRDSWRWNAYLRSLAAEPGVVVVSAERRWGTHYVTGLRDPLSRDPLEMLAATGLDPSTVVSQWEPYQALVPRFIVARAKILLQPPPEASLSYENGLLYVRGAVTPEWLADATRLSRGLPGVTLLRVGEAFDAMFDRIKTDIESVQLQFAVDASVPLPSEEQKVAALVDQFHELGTAAERANKVVRVEVIGEADPSGSQEWNLKLSQARAENLKSALLAAGVPRIEVFSSGIGTRQSAAAGRERPAAEHRRVTFRLSVAGNEPRRRNSR